MEPSFLPAPPTASPLPSTVSKKARPLNPETAPEQPPAAAPPRNGAVTDDSPGWQALLQATEERADEADKEIASLRDELLRVRAESENHRKRTERRMESNTRFAVEGFARDLLEVLDNIERALASADGGENNVAALRGGTEMTLKVLLDTLRRHGIEAIDPKQEKFDPNLHEALDMVPTMEQAPNTVFEVVQKGYSLRERLLRPARVRIATAPPQASELDQNADNPSSDKNTPSPSTEN